MQTENFPLTVPPKAKAPSGAYAKGFEWDVFISYSHVDNTERWVDDLFVGLRNRLMQEGIQASIYKDNRLGSTEKVDEALLDKLQSTAVLVSVISPPGVNSNWCQWERENFEHIARQQGGLFVDKTKSRMLKVIRTPLEGQGDEKLFEGALGVQFFSRDQTTGRPDRFRPEDARYAKCMDCLAYDIIDILRALNAKQQPDRPATRVFLSETSSDLRQQREWIKGELQLHGCMVMPAERLELDEDYGRLIQAAVESADLCVHLASEKAAATPAGATESLVDIQLRMSAELGKHRVVWLAPSTNLEGVRKELVFSQPECLSLFRGDDPQAIVQAVEDFMSAKNKKPVPEDGALPTVYMICDRTDHPFVKAPAGDDPSIAQSKQMARKVYEELAKNGMYVQLPPISALDPERMLEDHRKNMAGSHATIVYWGQAGEDWFRDYRLELIRRINQERGKQRKGQVAYVCPPSSEVKESPMYIDDEFVIADLSGPTPERLGELVSRVKEAL